MLLVTLFHPKKWNNKESNTKTWNDTEFFCSQAMTTVILCSHVNLKKPIRNRSHGNNLFWSRKWNETGIESLCSHMTEALTVPRVPFICTFFVVTALDWKVCLAQLISLPCTLNFSSGPSGKIFVQQQKE